jgi:hypothetical protein
MCYTLGVSKKEDIMIGFILLPIVITVGISFWILTELISFLLPFVISGAIILFTAFLFFYFIVLLIKVIKDSLKPTAVIC